MSLLFDKLYYEMLLLVLIKLNWGDFKDVVKLMSTATPEDFHKLLLYVEKLGKLNTQKSRDPYKYAIKVFELPSWMKSIGGA